MDLAIARESRDVVMSLIKFQGGAARNNAGIRTVHQITEINFAGLRCLEQGTVVRHVALHVPGRAQGAARLRRGAVIKIDVSEEYLRGPVKLSAGGDVKVGSEYDLFPRSRAAHWRSVGIIFRREVCELHARIELNYACLTAWPRHGGIRSHGVL